jgi:hypothetical protein
MSVALGGIRQFCVGVCRALRIGSKRNGLTGEQVEQRAGEHDEQRRSEAKTKIDDTDTSIDTCTDKGQARTARRRGQAGRQQTHSDTLK